jgi:hypothetical protein
VLSARAGIGWTFAALVACGSRGADAGAPGPVAQGCEAAPGATALCLTFSPEPIAPESDPALDTRGFLRVEVFEGPTASSSVRFRKTYPDDFERGGELSIGELPDVGVVLPAPLPAVFVRALFFDHSQRGPDGQVSGRPASPGLPEGQPKIDWGTWLGGQDLSYGIAGTSSLSPVELAEGETTKHDLPLVALRRVTATVTASVTPLGDGEGALSVFASRVDVLPPAAPTFGYGIDPCIDVNRGPHTVEMFLAGSGAFFVAASFEDLGLETPGKMPPGTLLTLHDFDPDTGAGTFDRITVEAEQYAASVSLDLASISPFPGDPSVLGPNSCADLGLPGPP